MLKNMLTTDQPWVIQQIDEQWLPWFYLEKKRYNLPECSQMACLKNIELSVSIDSQL